MELRDAADAFVVGWSTTRRLSGPFEVARRGDADWLYEIRRVGGWAS